jgi:hypothetical protein
MEGTKDKTMEQRVVAPLRKSSIWREVVITFLVACAVNLIVDGLPTFLLNTFYINIGSENLPWYLGLLPLLGLNLFSPAIAILLTIIAVEKSRRIRLRFVAIAGLYLVVFCLFAVPSYYYVWSGMTEWSGNLFIDIGLTVPALLALSIPFLPMFRYKDGRKVHYLKQGAANVVLFLMSLGALLLFIFGLFSANSAYTFRQIGGTLPVTRESLPILLIITVEAIGFGASIALFWGLMRYAEEKLARQSKGSAAR